MKVSLLGVAVVLLVVAVGYRQAKDNARKTDSDIRGVADVLERAIADAPPVPAGPPAGQWVDSLKAQCVMRERLLGELSRPAGLDGMGTHAYGVLAIHRAYRRRVSRLRPPAKYLAEARTVDRLNAQEVRALSRVARVAASGDIAAASREARSLRVLAGEANAQLLKLGLTPCLLRASSMPL